MKAQDLIATARSLSELDPRRPKQANLRRAVSTAYYAVFHSLAHVAADLIVGRGRTHNAAWHRVYRALEHGNAKNACLDKLAMTKFPHGIQDFADTFVDLQEARHQADYSYEFTYDRENTLAKIDKAANAIDQLKEVSIEHRRGLVAHLLFKRRRP